MIGITPERFADELKKAYPAPNEEYSHAFWCQEMIYLTEEVNGMFRDEFNSSLNFIRDENIVSAEFRVIRPTKDVRSVEMSLLKTELPKVYEKLVYIPNADVVRLLGGSRSAYEFVKEHCGGRTESVEVIGLKDLDKVLTADESARYISCRQVPTGESMVVRL